MTQILHILRKDIQRFRLFIALILTLQVLMAAITIHDVGVARLPNQFELLPPLCTIFLALGWTFLLAQVVLEDTPTGDCAFWLTRPYSRPALLSAKILFALLFLNLPLLISDLIILLSAGMPLDFVNLLLRQLPLIAVLAIPAFALSAISRNIQQFVLFLFGVILFCVLAGKGASIIPSFDIQTRGYHSDVPLILSLPALVLPVIAYQFLRRSTYTTISVPVILIFLLSGVVVSTRLAYDGLFITSEHLPLETGGRWSGVHFQLDQSGNLKLFESLKSTHLPVSILNLPPAVLYRGAGEAYVNAVPNTAHAFLEGHADGVLSLWPLDPTTMPGKKVSIHAALDGWALNDKPTFQKVLTRREKFTIPGVGLCAYDPKVERPNWSLMKMATSATSYWVGPVEPPDTDVKMNFANTSASFSIGTPPVYARHALIFGFVPVEKFEKENAMYRGLEPNQQVELTATPHFAVGHFSTNFVVDGYTFLNVQR